MAYSVQSYRFHSRVLNDLTDLTGKHDNLTLTSTGIIYADSTCQNPLDQPISLELSVINDLRVLVPQEITVLDADGYEIYKSSPVLIEDSNVADDGDTSILWDDVQNKPDFPSLYLGIGANAVSATKLVTARTINGASFNGTDNITFNTDAVAEGTTNKYYTDARVKLYGDTVYPQLSVQYTNPTWLAGIDATTIKTGTIDLARLPALPSANTIVCTTIPAMSAGDQLLVSKGTVVIESTTGNTYRYSGTGSVVENASYIQQSDMTPDWAVITNKPTNVSTWTNDAGYLTAASSLAWGKLTGVPATFTPSAHTHLWADLTDKPSTFAPSAHVHVIADTTGLQAALDSKQPTGAYLLLTSPLTGYAVGSNAALAATDTVLGAFNKIQAQLNAKQATGAYLTGNQTVTLSGEASGSGATAITVTLNNASVIGKVLTGLTIPASSAVVATDSILSAFGKVQAHLNAVDSNWANYAAVGHTHTFASLTSKPTTLAGYGITNAVSNSGNNLFQVMDYLGNTANDWVWFGYNGIHTNSSRYAGFMASKAGDVIVSARYNQSGYLNAEDSSNVTDNVASWNIDKFHVYKNLTVAGTITEGGTLLSAKYSLASHTHTFASLTSKPTTLSGYGITDALSSSYVPTWASITGKPTTLAGYGITDAVSSSDSRLTNTRTPTNNDWYVYGDNGTGSRSLTDFNAIVKSGFGSGPSATGSPTTGWYHIITNKYHGDTTGWLFQIAAGFGTTASPAAAEGYYVRIKEGTSAPTAWRKLWHDGNLTKASIGLGSVENTALSTWAGSSNITTIGTLSSGTVPWARISGPPSVVAGTGLLGTGQLTSNVTLSVVYGTAAGTACVGNDARLSDSRSPTAHNHDFSNVTGRTVDVTDITARTESGWYNHQPTTRAYGWPEDSSWWHMMSSTHTNTSNYYALQIAANFYAQDFRIRSTNGSGTTAWSKIWTNSDFSGTQITNWGTAYGWGNHASAGYATAASLANFVPVTGTVNLADGVVADNRWRQIASIAIDGYYNTHVIRYGADSYGPQWGACVEISVTCNRAGGTDAARCSATGMLNAAELFWFVDTTNHVVRLWIYRGGGNSFQNYVGTTIQSRTPGNITYYTGASVASCSDGAVVIPRLTSDSNNAFTTTGDFVASGRLTSQYSNAGYPGIIGSWPADYRWGLEGTGTSTRGIVKLVQTNASLATASLTSLLTAGGLATGYWTSTTALDLNYNGIYGSGTTPSDYNFSFLTMKDNTYTYLNAKTALVFQTNTGVAGSRVDRLTITGTSATFTVPITGTTATMGVAKTGTSTAYSGGAEFSNSAMFGTANYAFMQFSDGSTNINTAAGKVINFCNGNGPSILTIGATSITANQALTGTTATFSGNISVTHNAETAISVTTSNPVYSRAFTAVNSGVAVGGHYASLIGVALSNYNSGYVRFNYAGSGLSSNAMSIGLYGADNLVTVSPDTVKFNTTVDFNTQAVKFGEGFGNIKWGTNGLVGVSTTSGGANAFRAGNGYWSFSPDTYAMLRTYATTTVAIAGGLEVTGPTYISNYLRLANGPIIAPISVAASTYNLAQPSAAGQMVIVSNTNGGPATTVTLTSTNASFMGRTESGALFYAATTLTHRCCPIVLIATSSQNWEVMNTFGCVSAA